MNVYRDDSPATGSAPLVEKAAADETSAAPITTGAVSDHPPRARLVLRVGITGHRPDPEKRSDPDLGQLRETAQAIFKHIEKQFAKVAEDSDRVFDCPPDPQRDGRRGTLRVVSALAAGADQWLAEEALELRYYELQCPLPFQRDEYSKDFAADEASRQQFYELLGQAAAVLELDGKVVTDADGKRKPVAGSYAAVGRVILNQSDLLIAFWDGQESKGEGGTGQVVEEARQRGIPVIWIPWADPADWRLLEARSSMAITSHEVKDRWDQLDGAIDKLLRSQAVESVGHSGSAGDLREHYFREKQRRGNLLLGWWLLFRDYFCGDMLKGRTPDELSQPFKVEPFVKATKEEWNAEWRKTMDGLEKADQHEAAKIVRGLAPHINDAYLEHYAWANQLSVYYANLYRSSFVVNYLLGATTVCCALLGMAFESYHYSNAAFVSTLLELGLIVLILVITRRGSHKHWHERWIDYRTLAERLRLARFLILFGGGGQQFSLADHLAGYGNPAATWMHWHYRAIERTAGLLTAVFDKPYLQFCNEQWRKQLIRGQIRYHHSVIRRFSRLDKVLHVGGTGLFVVTAIACATHLMMHSSEEWGIWMTVFAASLPALGGALAAIRSQGEFHRVVQRSVAMHHRLTSLHKEMARISSDPGDLNSVGLRQCAGRVVELMINESLDWRIVFQDRPLGLPA